MDGDVTIVVVSVILLHPYANSPEKGFFPLPCPAKVFLPPQHDSATNLCLCSVEFCSNKKSTFVRIGWF